MTIQDILTSLRDGLTTADIGAARITAGLLAALLGAVWIFLVYRLKNRSGFYSREFNASCALMSVVSCAILLAMQSSLIVSLGMVGALSLIRFRNAVKSPVDMLFLFWSFALGIVCGTGLYAVGLALSVILTAGMLLLDLLPQPKSSLLLFVSGTSPALSAKLSELLKRYAKGVRVRSRSAESGRLDLVLELRTKDEAALLAAVSALPGVTAASLMTHSGDWKL